MRYIKTPVAISTAQKNTLQNSSFFAVNNGHCQHQKARYRILYISVLKL